MTSPGKVKAFVDLDLSSCTGLEIAIKMPEETDFTPKDGLMIAKYSSNAVIEFQVRRYLYGELLAFDVLVVCNQSLKIYNGSSTFIDRILNKIDNKVE